MFAKVTIIMCTHAISLLGSHSTKPRSATTISIETRLMSARAEGEMDPASADVSIPCCICATTLAGTPTRNVQIRKCNVFRHRTFFFDPPAAKIGLQGTSILRILGRFHPLPFSALQLFSSFDRTIISAAKTKQHGDTQQNQLFDIGLQVWPCWICDL
jgi:hypothetical protein